MITTCWNCQGVGNNLAVRHLKDILGQYNPQVLFLSETKQQRPYMEKLCEDTGFFDLKTVEPQGLSGGLALLWKEEVQVSILSSSRHWIDASITWQNQDFFLTGVYGEPIANAREDVWEALIKIGETRDTAWIMLGDFNELLSNDDKRGGRVRPESTFFAFRNMINKCGLIELPFTGNPLSWFGSRGGELVHCKLDRVLVNVDWFVKFPAANSKYLPRIGSDHSPILTMFQSNMQKKKGHFRYDTRWIERPGLNDLIKTSWDHQTITDELDIVARIRKCRTAMASWKRATNINSGAEIQRLKEQIDRLSSQSTIDWLLFKDLKCQLMKAYLQEEQFWKARSREHWLKEGDRNTKFFHASVKQRRAVNQIHHLHDPTTNTTYFREGDLKNLARKFFMDLYTSELLYTSEVRTTDMFLNVTPKVTAEHNTILLAPVSDSEIKKAAYDMASEKCPGPDGLTGGFYHQHWATVGPRVCALVRAFMETGELDTRLNETNICLIPKIRRPSKLTEFRPISLCNFSYKIIAKVLSSRLKKILPYIISDTQAAFVSGRLISDNILLAQELVHSLKANPSLSASCVAIKTDMMKAFDRVEWQFLEDAMRTLGFHSQWIAWIMTCVTTVSFGVLLNGQVSERFQPSRGIRQGDPLSPFLFILCTEILIMRLNREDTSQRLMGVQIAPTAPSISHLFFADDSLFFSSIFDSQLQILMQILQDYREASGQRVNFEKSSIIFGNKIPDQEKLRVQSDTGIHNVGGKGVYLGLPEAFVGSKTSTLRFLEEKTKSRISSWKNKYLSPGGKEVLIKAVAFALPTYAMSCYLIPKGMIDKLNQEIARFWWKNQQTGKGIHWQTWEKLTRSKQEGGLGFRNLEGFNIALLGKQLWRLLDNPDSLLARTLKARYYPTCSALHATLGSRPSFGWRSLLASQATLSHGLKREIGNGEGVNMWHDPWLLDSGPRPPQPQSHINIAEWGISDFKDDYSDQWRVDILQQVVEPGDIAKILQIKPGGPEAKQGYSWIHNDKGLYSVKSGYKLWEMLNSQVYNQVPEQAPTFSAIFKHLWQLNTSPKLKHFLWRCMTTSMAVGSELRKRKLTTDGSCSLCGNALETTLHLFFECAFSKLIWVQSPYISILTDTSCSIQGKIYSCMLLSEEVADDCKGLWPWLLWRIWKVRNEVVFQGTEPDALKSYNFALIDDQEWREHSVLISPQPPAVQQMTEVRWLPPPLDVLKCNTDATWQDEHDRCGASWILRSATGEVKFWGVKTFPKLLSPLDAEAAALVWATMCLMNMGYDNIIFESDSSSLVEAINDPQSNPRLLNYTSDIQGMITRHNRHCTFTKVNRQGNVAADALAKYAKDFSLYYGSIDNRIPLWLTPFLDVNV